MAPLIAPTGLKDQIFEPLAVIFVISQRNIFDYINLTACQIIPNGKITKK